MERCPHCKAPIYGDLPWDLINGSLVHKDGGLSVKFPAMETVLLERFLKAYPNPVQANSLIYTLWIDRNREEPLHADDCLRQYVHRLKKRYLVPINLTIRRVGIGSYVLEKVNG